MGLVYLEGDVMVKKYNRENKIKVAKDFKIYSRGVKKGTGLSAKQYGIKTGIDMKKSYLNMLRR